jgi:hypothetical protein
MVRYRPRPYGAFAPLARVSMKFSIGHRLFVAVILAIFSVAAISLALMRDKLMTNFSTYATQIELDRLEELGADIKCSSWNLIVQMVDFL